MYILTALVAFAGSFVQSSSGFGYAIICMAIWPMFMPFYTASILEAIAAFFMVIYIAVRLWKFIDWKLLLPPVIMATVTSFLGVNTLMALDEDVLSKIMGTVLLILAVYFIFFSSKVHLKASLVSGLAAGAISGFCGGLFNIGGPPMVAYFLSVTDDKEKYKRNRKRKQIVQKLSQHCDAKNNCHFFQVLHDVFTFRINASILSLSNL